MKTTLLIIFAIGIFCVGIPAHAQELYFDPTFDFLGDDRFEKGKRYLVGDAVTITGHSESYDEKTDEHIAEPDSVFEVTVKSPSGKIIIDKNYISDKDGDIEFSFILSDDFELGEYVVEMNVDKRRFLDTVFYVGHKKDMVIKTNATFDLYTKKEQPVLNSFVDLTGNFCGSPMSAASRDQTAFLLPFTGSILQRNSVQVLADFIDPNGDKITSTSHYQKDSCTEFTIGPRANVAGVWSANVTAWWIEGQTMYQSSSDSIQFTVLEPLYSSQNFDTMTLNPSGGDFRLLDWSSDGTTILWIYSLFEKDILSLMDSSGKTIRDLDINLDRHKVGLAKFSPDGKFIHFFTDSGLYRYDLQTSETLQLISGQISYFDYHPYDFDPMQYSIIVSVDKELYSGEDGNGNFVLVDIGSGDNFVDLKNGEPLIYDFNGNGFEFSPDGKKILYLKTLEASYGYANRALAYIDVNGEEFVVPDINVKCGTFPKWAPSGQLIVYEISSCGRGAPGSELHISTIDGTYSEIIQPYTNTQVSEFIISPDGKYIVYPTEGNSQLKKMQLVQPIPEFGTIAMMILLISILSSVIIFKSRKFNILSC